MSSHNHFTHNSLIFPLNTHTNSSSFVGGKNARGMRLSTNDPDDYQQQQPQKDSSGGQGQNQPGVGQYTPLQGSYSSTANTAGGGGNNKTLGNQRKVMVGGAEQGQVGQKVATISQNYNEKSMLLSSDDECQ